MGALLDFDPAFFGMRAIMLPDMIEMGEFGAVAAEIVPDAGKYGLDLRRRFFRESGRQVGSGSPVFACQGTDQTSDAAEQTGGLDRIEIADAAQQSDRQPAHGCVAERLGGVANAGLGAKQKPAHQKYTMILPNTCGISMRRSATRVSARITPCPRQAEGFPIACVSPFDTVTSIAGIERLHQLDRLACQDQRGVLAAKAERI